MNNLLTHYPVNWIDGMKLSSSHFIAVQGNRTCEQGMTEATGHTFQNVLQLLERATR